MQAPKYESHAQLLHQMKAEFFGLEISMITENVREFGFCLQQKPQEIANRNQQGIEKDQKLTNER